VPPQKLTATIGVAILCAFVGWLLSPLTPAETVPTAAAIRGAQVEKGGASQVTSGQDESHGLIPIHFDLPDDGEVTLIIEDSRGKRIRNLISQSAFRKGPNTAWWDGTDDLTRDPEAYQHGVYSVPGHVVQPGTYTVRGVWHRPFEARYEMSVYSPGTPPWATADGTGGWMSNHTPTSSVAFVPAERSPTKTPLVYLGAWISEGRPAFSWLDLNGHKLGGKTYIGGAYTGAQYIALDQGSTPDPATSLYVASVWKDKDRGVGVDGPAEIRLTKLTPRGDRPVLTPVFTFPYLRGSDPALSTEMGGGGLAVHEAALGGMAVWNGLIVLTQTELDKVIFIDAKLDHVLGTTTLSSPRGVAFDRSGRLLMLSGTSLLRFANPGNSALLANPMTLISGFEDPQGIALDSSGKIYVSDQGNNNQVKIYSENGKPVGHVGQAGPSQIGPYNPNHMNHPKGVAVDSNGRLWVAENEFRPKRVSVWNSDGTLWRAYYGPPNYGGGGFFDSQDVTRFLYDGMEFQVDWQKRDYQLKRVYLRRETLPFSIGFRGALPEMPVYIAGHRYLSNALNTATTLGSGTAFLFLDKGQSGAVPAAAMGRAQEWNLLSQPEYRALWPSGTRPIGDRQGNPAFFMWSDLNGNGRPEPDEITIRPGYSGGVTIGQDGSFFIAHFAERVNVPGHALRIRPTRVTGQNVPVYDDAHVEDLGPSQRPAGDGGDQVLAGTDGWLVQTTAPPPFSNYGVGGSRHGIPMWSYPSLWPGLHASHTSPPPDRPGMLIGTTRLLGELTNDAQGGPMFFLNGNLGCIYVFTQDGLFLAQLFRDERQGKRWQMPIEQHGALINELSLSSENFFPSITQAPNGKVYLQAGTVPGIVRIDGLDTVKRFPSFKIQVSDSDLRKSQEHLLQTESERQAAAAAPKILKATLLPSEVRLDGNPENLHIADWAPIDTRGVKALFNANTKPYAVKGGMVIAGQSLVAAWETGEPNLLVNSAQEITTIFHTGGGLDLMLQTDSAAKLPRSAPAKGDLRLFVTLVGGQTRAVLFVPVAPGSDPSAKAFFRSPWQTITFDRVTDISSQVKLAADGQGGYEVSVPLKVLGFEPVPGLKVKGDIGILRSSGGQVMQRVYWANKATGIVSDIPSEAMLTPNLWGVFDFER
jgi:hypothetical protein